MRKAIKMLPGLSNDHINRNAIALKSVVLCIALMGSQLLVQFTGGRHWPNLQDGISARTPVVTSTAPDRVSWRPISWTPSAYGADCHGRLCLGDAHRILTLARLQSCGFFLLFFSSLQSLSRCFSLPFHTLLLQNLSCTISNSLIQVQFSEPTVHYNWNSRAPYIWPIRHHSLLVLLFT
jgi:hypothetical protein